MRERAVEVLPAAPGRVPAADGGTPFGVYGGRVGEVDLAAAARAAGWGAPHRILADKRWRFVGVFAPDVLLGVAIVRAGYLASSFAFAFERASRRLTDRQGFGLPWACGVESGRGETASRAHFRGLTLRAEADRSSSGETRLLLRARGLRAEVEVAAPRSVLARVAPVRPAGVNVTHKAAGVPARGFVEVRGTRFDLALGFAVLDDTCGLLARETRWRWAAAAGKRWGLNLCEGFNDEGGTENAVWRDGELHPVGRAAFEFDRARPADPWRLTTADGAVDLTFHPEGVRAANVRLGLVESVYRAPLGAFEGRLLGEAVEGLPGVTEDHVARW